jgi:hypothetical protein
MSGEKYKYHEIVYICEHVFRDERPVLHVCKTDGDWQFLCGGDHSTGLPVLVGMGHLIERDRTLLDILDLQEGWQAERNTATEPWERSLCETD